MILDRLPMKPGDCDQRNFSAGVESATVASSWFNFDATTGFVAQGNSLYLFDSYTMHLNISPEAFADSVGLGSGQTPSKEYDYKPVFQILVPAASGGVAAYFPTLYPAVIGAVVPIRAWAMNPTSGITPIVATFKFRLRNSPLIAVTQIRAILGLTVYEIKNRPFIDAFQKGNINWEEAMNYVRRF